MNYKKNIMALSGLKIMISLSQLYLTTLLTTGSSLASTGSQQVAIALIEPDASPQLHNVTKRRAGIEASITLVLKENKEILKIKNIEIV